MHINIFYMKILGRIITFFIYLFIFDLIILTFYHFKLHVSDTYG